MKKIAIIIAIILMPILKIKAQDFSSTFDFNGTSYSIKMEKMNNDFKTTLKKGAAAKDFTISPFVYKQFLNGMTTAMTDYKTSALSTTEISEVATISSRLFFEITADLIIDNDDDSPIAGELNIKNKVKIYYYDEAKSTIESLAGYSSGNADKPSKNPLNTNIKYYDEDLKIMKVQLEFLEGFLENILVEAINSSGEKFQFTNSYGIGFTSKNNYAHLTRIKLHDILHDYGRFSSTQQKPFIFLGGSEGVLVYTPKLRLRARDYSPKDGVYVLVPNQENNPQILYKESTQKLFEARVYSDFLGIDREKPNGLVQTEVTKRINTNTYRGLIFQDKYLGLPRFIFGEGGGIFQYVAPVINISKFEENNKYFNLHIKDELKTTITDRNLGKDENVKDIIKKDTTYNFKSSKRYITPIDLIRNQSWSVGIDANIFYTENVAGKFNMYFDLGFRYGNTPVRDSLTIIDKNKIITSGIANTFGVTSLQWSGMYKMHWLPDERFSFELSYRPTYVRALNNEALQAYYNKIDSNDLLSTVDTKNKIPWYKNSWTNSFEFFAYFKPNENGKIFFRFRHFSQKGNNKYNFNQLQVGYSFNILKNR